MQRRTVSELLAALCAGLALIGAPVQAADYEPEYKMSLVVGTTFPWGKGGGILADLVRQRTNGRINIKLYPGASLVGGTRPANSPRCARA